jgi:hypothetical protein
LTIISPFKISAKRTFFNTNIVVVSRQTSKTIRFVTSLTIGLEFRTRNTLFAKDVFSVIKTTFTSSLSASLAIFPENWIGAA